MTTPSPPRPLIGGPSAWVGAELAKRPADWTYDLKPVEIAEVERAAAGVRDAGLDLGTITRDRFPLPILGPTLDRLRGEILDGRGFVLLRGLPVAGKNL